MNNRAFTVVLIAVSFAFLLLLRPFYHAIFWAATLAILFWPVHRRLLARMPARPGLAALVSLLMCLVIVIVPITLLVITLANEVVHFYARAAESGGIGGYLERIAAAIPPWAQAWFERLGAEELRAVQERVSEAAGQALQFLLARAVGIGQNTLQVAIGFLLMLYLLFFFFLDGDRIIRVARSAIPMERAYVGELAAKFVTVVKATIKGNLVVAAIQGALGGLMFWVLGIPGPVLWGVVMAFLSLLPAIGAWLVWAPVAIYLLATGSVAKGLVVIAFGAGVIGLIDNLLRPILVGKETRMPDYLVLLSTLGGLALFGLTGFVAGPVIAALFLVTWEIFIVRLRNAPAGADDRPGTGAG
ncbi:AI-2E family transporter [Pseudoxanthomonas suwonensis]|nr:AI-2E family transporter [Pseudoxanthomonas suwonensis]